MSGPGGTAATLEASGTKGEIMICLDLVLGFLEQAICSEKRESEKGEEKRQVLETEKNSG